MSCGSESLVKGDLIFIVGRGVYRVETTHKFQKTVLNACFKEFWYTITNQTQIWYGKVNLFVFMAKNCAG